MIEVKDVKLNCMRLFFGVFFGFRLTLSSYALRGSGVTTVFNLTAQRLVRISVKILLTSHSYFLMQL